MKVLKRIGTIVISVLLWVVILVAALYAFTTMASRDNQNVANLFGYTPPVSYTHLRAHETSITIASLNENCLLYTSDAADDAHSV